jgi:hypothetical protein
MILDRNRNNLYQSPKKNKIQHDYHFFLKKKHDHQKADAWGPRGSHAESPAT